MHMIIEISFNAIGFPRSGLILLSVKRKKKKKKKRIIEEKGKKVRRGKVDDAACEITPRSRMT